MMENETKKGVSGGVLFIIIVLCLLLGLTSGYILNEKLSNKEESKQEEKKEETKEEEKTEENNKTETKETYEKKTYEIDVNKDCNGLKCTKSYDIQLKGKDYKLTVYNHNTATYEQGTYITVNDNKLDLHFDYVNSIAIIDSNIVAIGGNTTPDNTLLVYFDSNFNKKDTVSDYDASKITSKSGTYKTCEPITCDDQTETFYSYTLNDDGTINSKVEKVKEHTFCSAQC